MIFTFGLAPLCPIPEAAVETAKKHWVRGLHWLVCCRYNITFALQKCQLTERHFLLEWSEEWQETEFTQLSNEYAKTFWVILKMWLWNSPFSLCSCEEINVTAYNVVKHFWKLLFPAVLLQGHWLSLCLRGGSNWCLCKGSSHPVFSFSYSVFSTLKSLPILSFHLYEIITPVAKSDLEKMAPLVLLCHDRV